MYQRISFFGSIVVLLLILGSSCGGGSNPVEYNPIINPADFSTTINNQYMSLVPGTTFRYQATTPDGVEDTEVVVTTDIKTIIGVTCVVVRDTVKLDGSLIEDTFDWYAQDTTGNVWYFGEDSKQYENGVQVGMEGSWESGIGGAKPGIVMEAHPAVGDKYRNEYKKGVAEDWSDVVALNQSAVVPYDSFTNCLKTHDYTPLESDANENKYYAPGVGMVLTFDVTDNYRDELLSVTNP